MPYSPYVFAAGSLSVYMPIIARRLGRLATFTRFIVPALIISFVMFETSAIISMISGNRLSTLFTRLAVQEIQTQNVYLNALLEKSYRELRQDYDSIVAFISLSAQIRIIMYAAIFYAFFQFIRFIQKERSISPVATVRFDKQTMKAVDANKIASTYLGVPKVVGMGRDFLSGHKHTSNKEMSIQAVPINNKYFNLSTYMLSSRDVLVQMTDVTSIVKANKDNERKVKQFQQVAYVTRHDLRNSVDNIEWALTEMQAIATDDEREKYRDLFYIALPSIKDLILKLEGIRDWTRAIEGEGFTKESFDLNEALKEHIKASEYGTIELSDLGIITGNKGLLIGSVFKNLLYNAFYYGGSKVRVYKDGLDICLEDDAGGIACVDGVFSKERWELIKQPFQRGDSGKPGSGLGLAITEAILDKHGWFLDVKVNCGVGSTFIIRMA
jgi:signal transduction histidine kinase